MDFDIATPHDVSIVIKEESSAVVGASSGRAGYGMSVRWEKVKLENVDDDTLRITWIGPPVDASLGALVYKNETDLGIVIIQPEPPANSAAPGYDRVLVLDFSEPVRAEDVAATIQGGLDTAN